MALPDFLSSIPQLPLKALTSTGYSATNLDILTGAISRSKLIQQNYITDYMFMENDRNFLRKHPSTLNKLNQISSKLSLSTQMVTTVNALLTMSKIYEFIPSNVKSVLQSYIGLADTGILAINNIADGSIIRKMQGALLNDLLAQFDTGSVSLIELQNMATSFFNNYHMFSQIENLGIRSILGIPVTSLLPAGALGVYEDLAFLDNLYTIFGDVGRATNFLNQFKELVKPFSETKVQSFPATADYKNNKITLDDPLGITTVETLASEIQKEYIKTTNSFVDKLQTTNSLTPTEVEQIKQLNAESVTAGFEETFNSNIGLPSLQSVINALNVESYNQTVEAIKETLEYIPKKIVQDIGLMHTDGSNPIDFLYNLKKFIETRNSFKTVGATLDRFTEVDKYVKAIVGKKASDADIENIYTKILKALKENG